MKKTRVAVIGAGNFGRFHAEKFFEIESAELVGVVDTDLERAEKLAARLETKAYSSHEEIVDLVDAVSIVTPTETHFDIAMSLLTRGIDVLVEKPLTVTVEEADLLIGEAERNGALLQVGHLERFNPAVVALRGKVNPPLFIKSERLSPFPHRATDVSVVDDLMIHDIDIILNLVDSDVEAIDAVGVPVISDKSDIVNAWIRFKNGSVANVTASRVSMETVRKMRIFQHDAYISIDYAAQQIAIRRREGDGGGLIPSIVNEDVKIEKKDALLAELRSFLQCSADGKEPLVTGRDGKKAIEVARKIREHTAASMERFFSSSGGALA